MAGYTRQSEAGIVDGGIISADDLNNEFDQIETAMGASGHSHTGAAGEGPKITSSGLANSAVITDRIADSAVTTAKINNNAVTTDKLAADAVTGTQIDETTTITAASFVGPLTGDVTGNVTGNITGNVTGNITGNVTGNVTGDVTGDVTGNLTGNVTGNVTGNLDANAATIDSLIITSGTAVTSIDTDLSSVSANHDTLPSAKAVVAYVDSASLDEISGDTSPELGGNLSTNGYNITFLDGTNSPPTNKLQIGTGGDYSIWHSASYGLTQINMDASTYYDLGTDKSMVIGSGGIGNPSYVNNAIFTQGAGTKLYYNGSKKFETLTGGVDITGNLTLSDSDKVILGDGNDLNIYHDGTNNKIETSSGVLLIGRSSGGDHQLSLAAPSGSGGTTITLDSHPTTSGHQRINAAEANYPLELQHAGTTELSLDADGVHIGDMTLDGTSITNSSTSSRFSIYGTSGSVTSQTIRLQGAPGTGWSSYVEIGHGSTAGGANLILKGVQDFGNSSIDSSADIYVKKNGTTIHTTHDDGIMLASAKGIGFGTLYAVDTLDDYEEGTWQPAWDAETGAFGSITYSSQLGKYTKVGNAVHVSVVLSTSSVNVGTAAGRLYITGLPYTVSGRAIGSAWGAFWSTNQPRRTYVPEGGTIIYLYADSESVGVPVSVSPSNMSTSTNSISLSFTYLTS